MENKQQTLQHIGEQLQKKKEILSSIEKCSTRVKRENVQEVFLCFYEGKNKIHYDKILISKEGKAEEQLISDIADALEKYRNTRMKEVDEIDKELESLLK